MRQLSTTSVAQAIRTRARLRDNFTEPQPAIVTFILRKFGGAWSPQHPRQDVHGTDRYCQDGTEQDLWPLKDHWQTQSVYATSSDRG